MQVSDMFLVSAFKVRIVLPLWSEPLLQQWSTGMDRPWCKQHGTKTRTEHEEPRCAALQLARRKPPALPTTSETLVDEAESRKTIKQFGVRVFIIS